MFPEKNLEIHIYYLKKSKELLAQKWNENCSPGPVVQPGDVGPSERGKIALNLILANTSSRKESELNHWSHWSSRKFRFHREVLVGTADVERQEPGCILKEKNSHLTGGIYFLSLR